MSRLTIALIASVCVVLMTLATGVKAQGEIHEIHAVQTQPQSPGFLERIMNDYVYPLRDYDWRGVVRRFLNGVMDYISPDAKEPKSDFGDYPYKNQHNAQEISTYSYNDAARPLGLAVAKWVIDKASSRFGGHFPEDTSNSEDTPQTIYEKHSETAETQTSSNSGEPQSSHSGHSVTKRSPAKSNSPNSALTNVPSDSRAINLNTNVTAPVASYSWSYLGFLVAYSIFSVLGALIPLYKLPPEEPLLEPELTMPQQNYMQEGNFQNIR